MFLPTMLSFLHLLTQIYIQRAREGGCYPYFTDEDTKTHEVTPFVQGHRANKAFGPEFKATELTTSQHTANPLGTEVLTARGVEV